MGGCCGEPVEEASPDANNRMLANSGQVVSQQPGAQQGLQWQEKVQYQPPNVPTPPPVLQYGQPLASAQNGMMQNVQNIHSMQQMQQNQWSNSNGTSQGQFSPYSQTSSPPPGTVSPMSNSTTLANGTFNNAGPFAHSQAPSSFGEYTPSHSPPLTQPSPAHTFNSPMSVTMSVTGRQSTLGGVNAAPESFVPHSTDEGKVSVSIDFGKWRFACVLRMSPVMISSSVAFRYHLLRCCA